MKLLWIGVSSFSLLIVSLTMLCRANDLRWRRGLKWQVRMVGFVLSGAMPLAIIASQFYYDAWPSPYEAMFHLGLMFVFVTTPLLPPWWKWISGEEPANDTN